MKKYLNLFLIYIIFLNLNDYFFKIFIIKFLFYFLKVDFFFFKFLYVIYYLLIIEKIMKRK